MEDTLRASHYRINPVVGSLNPCFNGRYSQSAADYYENEVQGLNPCFNGRYSQRKPNKVENQDARN